MEGSPIGRGHRLENGSGVAPHMSVRLALSLLLGEIPKAGSRGLVATQVGRSHRDWRKGPNPFLSSTAAWRKTVARRAVNSSGPGSNPGAAAAVACSSAAERPRDMGEVDRFDPVQANPNLVLGSVAHLDRAPGFDPGGSRFDPCRGFRMRP